MLKHPNPEGKPSGSSLLLAGSLLTGGCSEPPGEAPANPPAELERQLDTQTEVLHQTREVLRYMEEEERLRRQRVEELGLEAGAASAP